MRNILLRFNPSCCNPLDHPPPNQRQIQLGRPRFGVRTTQKCHFGPFSPSLGGPASEQLFSSLRRVYYKSGYPPRRTFIRRLRGCSVITEQRSGNGTVRKTLFIVGNSLCPGARGELTKPDPHHERICGTGIGLPTNKAPHVWICSKGEWLHVPGKEAIHLSSGIHSPLSTLVLRYRTIRPQ